MFRPGPLTVADAAKLNKLMEDVRYVKTLKVAAPLRIRRDPAGMCIEQPPPDNGRLSIPVAYCDANGELAYYYICIEGDFTWSIGACEEPSESSSSSGS